MGENYALELRDISKRFGSVQANDHVNLTLRKSEILAILGVTENTLKFHNKNIYNKLGVSSRKQLLRYATLLKQQEGKEQQ